MKDIQGILRGQCKVCDCTEYDVSSRGRIKCETCGHVPTRHKKIEYQDNSSDSDGDSPRDSRFQNSTNGLACKQPPVPQSHSDMEVEKDGRVLEGDNQDENFCITCQVQGCTKMASYDLNSGQYNSVYCFNHMSAVATTSQLNVAAPTNAPPTTTGVPPTAGVAICAIPECNNPCFVDQQGKAFECCGYTHAMELQRRKALASAPSVKGITHCLLPECNNPVWPFMNYCGRGHADMGRQRGLQPPVPQDDGQSSKSADCCILPGCKSPKYVDANDGTVHPYCGRTHAEQAKQLGILPTTDDVSDQCDLSGCTQPKRKEQDGTIHDYCCRDHAVKDIPNRDAKMLTSRREVDKYLQKFGNLQVVKIEENPHAKEGGVLFNKFKDRYSSLPKNQRTTQLAFHGTPEANIPSICTNGYDPSRRSGQAYGPGEYFALSPNTSMGYCGNGRKMLLNELLLGQNGVDHTRHGDVIVMKDPAHDLPRFIVTFQ